MKPSFPYYGAKEKLARWIVAQMPRHDVYVEPFAGSAAVLFAKRPARTEVVNDVNANIVCFFRVLRDRPDELLRACELTPYARDEFMAADLDDQSIDELERARRWWVVVNQGFDATARPKNGWSLSQTGEASTTQRRLNRMHACAQRLTRVAIENRDAFDLIDAYDQPGVVIYLDPPYHKDARASFGAHYAVEFRTDANHVDLASRLKECAATVLLSGQHTAVYSELYADWHVTERGTRRSSGAHKGTSDEVTEVLWSNRPLQTQGVLI